MEFQELRGKVALITGASSGLGRHIAHELAHNGADVVLHYYSRLEDTVELSSQLSAQWNVNTTVLQADVSDEKAVQAMVASAQERFGRIDILIGAAGISIDAITWKMSLDAWQKVIAVNLTGAFLCCKHVVPLMRSQGWGRIVLLSSVVAQLGVPGTVAYAASKAGLFGLTRTLSKEVVKSGITVNCLALGYFAEGMMLQLPAEVQEQITMNIPMKRLGRGQEVAATVEFLCGSGADYLTGQIISINGGLFL
ncbi:MAG: 3-oxoacyl-ACP reductase FabG [Anaerolineae bacterium]|nr:3-oxoacyl-ACP reductase FabG [Anaerolineae bacterium]